MSRLSDATEWYAYLCSYYDKLDAELRATPQRRVIYRWRLRRARERMWAESGEAFRKMLKEWAHGS